MKLTKLGILAVAGLVTLSSIGAEDHHAASASFKTTKVKDNLFMLSGKGGNLAVLNGAQGILMIDDDYKAMSPVLTEALRSFGGVDKLTYIINTHWHGDHTEGNLFFGEHATIVAHDNVRQRLITPQEIKLFKKVTEAYPEKALPSVTYDSKMHLYFNGEDVELVHLPNGHTDGDSVILFKKANVVHAGDHFFNGIFPFVDLEHGGNVLNMAHNISELLKYVNGETVIIPGHGAIAGKNELVAFRDMLVGTSAEVQAMIDSGMTMEQAKNKGLSEKWEPWTHGFLSTPVWLGIVYQSLMQDKNNTFNN